MKTDHAPALIHTGQRYFGRKEAADYLRLSKRTLDIMAVRGGGPLFCKLGRRAIYRVEDLDAWVAARIRASTSDKGARHD